MQRLLTLTTLAILVLSSFALARHAESADATGRRLRVVYFTPTDRQPEPDRVERLDRVLTETRRFYQEGMKQQGFGPLTFDLERDEQGKLRIHEVQARGPMRNYGRNDAGKVRAEVKAALATRAIDVDRETIIVFQQLLEWRGETAVEVGPYVGGGNAWSGTAWVYDDAKLDPRLLSSRDKGGYYHGPCSIGKFNTHYLGGVLHELGHALGLPHERERPGQRGEQGHSLMGSGNHTYGQELRGEGRGTFLSAASAFPLAVHPLFTHSTRPSTPLTCRLVQLNATAAAGKLSLAGHLVDGLRVVSLVAYNDPQATPGDYDAIGWTTTVDRDGQFKLEIEDLEAGRYELRLRAIGESGDTRYFSYRYSVDASKTPDVAPLQQSPLTAEALAAFARRDQEKLAQLLQSARQLLPEQSIVIRKIEHLSRLLQSTSPRSLADVPAEVKSVRVSEVAFAEATVGWGQPLRDRVLAEEDGSILLEVAGQFQESGLYAHAPARHSLRTRGQWKTLHTRFGLQDGHAGSVVFVIRGDGRELFRSKKVGEGEIATAEVPIAGVERIELIVENAGDGNRGDWGVWLAPELRR